ncbi:MAG: mechanosensitive ion channel [Acidobacteriota bacterium]|nr:MAG: mechanosensitive ion channel [Acidobacteriota bacterium]
MNEMWEQFRAMFGTYLPSLVGAFALLIVGWLLALILSAIVRRTLARTRFDEKLAGWAVSKEDTSKLDVGRWVGRGVFYLAMAFVLVGFFQILNLTLVIDPLNTLLNQIFAFAPKVFGALLLILLAWVLASVLRAVLMRVLSAARLDERIGGEDDAAKTSVTRSFAEAVYWLVFLLFLPAILGALQLEGILRPVQEMLDRLLGFLPNVFAAALILLVGWFVARIVRRVITNLLSAAGADKLGERIGLTSVAGEQGISGLLGLIAYALILVPVLIAALNALALDAITRPASEMLATLLDAIPAVLGAAVVLVLAYAVGRIVAGLVTNLLEAAGFNNVLARIGIAASAEEPRHKPADWAGHLVLVAIMLFATIEAARLLGFEILSELVARFLVFAGHVLLGLIVFAIGLYLANLASSLVRSSRAAQAGLLARASWIAIVLLAAAIGLGQMGVNDEIIHLAFGLLLGAAAVAIALAFGLGGRAIAEEQIRGWLRSMGERRSEGPHEQS